MEEDAITGVEETDVSESSTEEQAPETTDVETETDDYDDLSSPEETEEGEAEDKNQNKIPQDRFGKVIEERNSERTKREAAEKELEMFKAVMAAGRQTPKDEPVDTGIDYSAYMNDSGELDLNSYTRDLTENISAKLKGELKQESEYERREQREWDEAVTAYPELAQNERLANLVRAAKTQNIINGKFTKFSDVADEVFAEFGRVREAGAESVRRSEKIQSGAGLVDMGTAESRVTKASLTNADVAKMSVPDYQKAVAAGDIDRAIKAGTLKGYNIR
jgi:hypothetical protein